MRVQRVKRHRARLFVALAVGDSPVEPQRHSQRLTRPASPVMYAIKTRSGGVYLKMLARNGASARPKKGVVADSCGVGDTFSSVCQPATDTRGCASMLRR